MSTALRCSQCRLVIGNPLSSRYSMARRWLELRKPISLGKEYYSSDVTREIRDYSEPRFPTSNTEEATQMRPTSKDEAFKSEDSTPWYLQVEAPRREDPPLLQRQQLPELPPDSPPLLEHLLKYISVDLGLDDLTLLDLRDIDPPSALGANLLMILGTTRSEKHLHVSADRFCRWLKTTYNLRPYADGLLGRGELKLKLRRKARRARLLSNVGSSDARNVDDGIRTGWVCVNIGAIPDANRERELEVEHEDFVGFGDEVEGTKVVIQMLTQEKREDLDLESLWGRMVRRREKKAEKLAAETEQLSLADQLTSPKQQPEAVA